MNALKVIAQLPMGLFDEVASGTGTSLEELFEKYGYSASFANECRGDPRFNSLVNERKVELEKTGQLHANRAAAVADMTLSELARRVTDGTTPTPVLLSIYQHTAKLGRLEAPSGAVVAAGPGFSISIHLEGSKPTEKEVKDVRESTTTIEHDEICTDDLGPVPAYLKANKDLECE